MSFLAFYDESPKKRREARAQARIASDFLKALSHDGRFLILCLLGEGEATVTEITSKLGMRQAVVSQQLTRLRLDGLVEARREGRNVHYSLVRREVTALVATLDDLFGKPARRASRGRT